jgi:hypothetical protein
MTPLVGIILISLLDLPLQKYVQLFVAIFLHALASGKRTLYDSTYDISSISRGPSERSISGRPSENSMSRSFSEID